jgi:hypothetical protein
VSDAMRDGTPAMAPGAARDSTRGRLARYALFQAHDYVRERGLPLLVIGALLMLMSFQSAGGPPPRVDDAGDTAARALALAAALLELFAPTAVLVGVNGIISSDRKHHYYRLLFSKPVSASRYYAQAFLVSLAGTLVATLLVLAAFALCFGTVPVTHALLFVLLYFMLFGGVGFLLSAITSYDWIALGVVWSLAWLLRAFFPPGESWYGRVLDILLPPLHLLAGAAAPLLGGVSIGLSASAWIVGYGIAAVAIALLVVRYRPMAS